MKIPEEAHKQVEGQQKQIGKLLLEHTTLTADQLSEALDIQKESNLLLGEILTKKNYIHPHDIIKVVCIQMDIPYLEKIDVDNVDADVVRDISINYARQHEVLPILETDYTVTIVLTDPFKFSTLADLQSIFKKEIKTVVTTPLKITEAINRVYERANQNTIEDIESEFEDNLDLEGTIDILDANADEAPIIRFINQILFRAIKENASDIHIEPYEKEVIFRFRIHGVMTEVMRQPIKTHPSISSRIKVMGKMNISEKRLPQDGRIKIKLAGKDIDIRVNTVPCGHGERIVMRLLEKDNVTLDLEALGFRGRILKDLKDLCGRKNGVVYVTGPTGSGKTTTLAAMLDRINSPHNMIITVEDPVEYDLNGISQIQVNHKIKLSFALALRAILRQDPDIIMVGETRDFETAEMVIQSSLTGHFVLSTLHTNDAASCPTRLIDMGVQPFLISSSLVAVLAQRLVKPLCFHCKKRIKPSKFELSILGVDHIPEDATICAPVGCPNCNGTGHSGRTTIAELMIINDELRGLILQQSDSSSLRKAAIKSKMVTLRDSALEKVYSGTISIEEMFTAINIEDEDKENEDKALDK